MGLLDQITSALGQQSRGCAQTNQLLQLGVNVINNHPVAYRA